MHYTYIAHYENAGDRHEAILLKPDCLFTSNCTEGLFQDLPAKQVLGFLNLFLTKQCHPNADPSAYSLYSIFAGRFNDVIGCGHANPLEGHAGFLFDVSELVFLFALVETDTNACPAGTTCSARAMDVGLHVLKTENGTTFTY